MLLVLAMILSLVKPLTVSAGDTLPYVDSSAKGENQPYSHGYRTEDLLNWTPESDLFSDLLRSR